MKCFFEKPRHRSVRRIAALSLLALSAFPLWARAQGVSGGTPSLGDSASNAYWNDVPEVTEVLTHDGVGAGIDSFSDICKKEAAAYEALRDRTIAASKGTGVKKALREKGEKIAAELDSLKSSNAKAASWSQRFGNFLDKIDIVSTFAKAAGYAWEGDRTGAVGVFVDEGAKKVTTGFFAAAGSVVPGVGSMAGASLGEHLHESRTSKAIEGRVDEVRNREAREKLLGANLPREKVIDAEGHVRTLPPDMYLDRETGNIRQRTPEEQRAREDQYRREIREKGTSDHPLDVAQRERAEGKISETEFDKRVKEFNEPEKEKERKRRKGRRTGEEAGEEAKEKVDEEKTDRKAAGSDEEEETDAGEDEGDAAPPKVATDRILEFVTPRKVKAAGSVDDDMSAGKIRNIVTTRFTLSFWNVGALVGGYDGATLHFSSVASLNGARSQGSCSGSFSGGPNGTFRIRCDGGSKTLALRNGQSIRFDSTTLTVENPGAFSDWPKGF